MRDVLPMIERWHGEGHAVAVATVVAAWGSAPRPLGAKMVVSAEGAMAGSVSGGCVEGAVAEEAAAVLASGVPRLLRFGVTRDQAWAVGLSCGGTIEVFVAPEAVPDTAAPEPTWRMLCRALAEERTVAVVTVVGADAASAASTGARMVVTRDGVAGSLGAPDLDALACDAALGGLASFASERLETKLGDHPVDLFVEVHPPRRTLIVVGAVHAAIHLVRFARELGFRTVVVDPRTAFATAERFADADQLVTDWPDQALRDEGLHAGSFVVLLSHDLKLDLPALDVALTSEARYIGALGSRKTHAKRVRALEEAGFGADAIGRIHNPIGLPLGGRRAVEIAVSVLAEMVAVDHGRGLAVRDQLSA